MNKKLFIFVLGIVSITSAFMMAQAYSAFTAIAQEEDGMTNDTQSNTTGGIVSNMTEELSKQGEILHDRG